MALTKTSFKKIGKYLKVQREKAKLSQKQVANELGYTTAQFVSNWERGLVLPPIAYPCDLDQSLWNLKERTDGTDGL